MRVMVLVKATEESEARVMPSAELITAMGRFTGELGPCFGRRRFPCGGVDRNCSKSG